MLADLPRLPLAHLPTPLVKPQRLAEALGLDLWVKRDDATGGAEGGNKIRKLELLLADAVAAGAGTVITCGGLQSNHARATAICAATLGLRAVLYLRAGAAGADKPPRPSRWRATCSSTASSAPRSASSPPRPTASATA